MLEYQIKPDTCAATVAFHKGMRHVHFHVFAHYLVECSFWHILDIRKNRREMQGIGKCKTALTDVLCSYLPSKVIKAAEEIGVNLLKAFYAPRLQ